MALFEIRYPSLIPPQLGLWQVGGFGLVWLPAWQPRPAAVGCGLMLGHGSDWCHDEIRAISLNVQNLTNTQYGHSSGCRLPEGVVTFIEAVTQSTIVAVSVTVTHR